MAYLHIKGCPLASVQGDLTVAQRRFLAIAIPELNRRIYGDVSKETGLGGVGVNNDLKNKFNQKKQQGGR